MRVLQINSVCGVGSTGRICIDIAKRIIDDGHECKIAYGRGNVPDEYKDIAKRIGNNSDVKISVLHTRITDKHGFANNNTTKNFLDWADEYNPDVLWLHNIHGYYINVEMLFEWIKSRPKMEVKWMLHDCWAFTGHCSYFSAVNCDKWKNECDDCIQKKNYPQSLVSDNSKDNYNRKKIAFTGVNNMSIIVPSDWLRQLVKQSFLKEYPVQVQYHSIDKKIFKPTLSNIRERYGLQNKKIILGVSNIWDERKGLNDFLELLGMLDDSYKIVLVGLNKKQIKKMPSDILAVERTDNISELAQFYTAADIFINPSKEETFGLTTVEAVSCGCPTIVYKGTACEEIVDKFGGVAVEQGVINIYKQIVCMTK